MLHVEGFCQLQTRLAVSALWLLVVFVMLLFLQIVSKRLSTLSTLSSPNCGRDTPHHCTGYIWLTTTNQAAHDEENKDPVMIVELFPFFYVSLPSLLPISNSILLLIVAWFGINSFCFFDCLVVFSYFPIVWHGQFTLFCQMSLYFCPSNSLGAYVILSVKFVTFEISANIYYE